MNIALEARPEVYSKERPAVIESQFDQLCADEDFDAARNYLDSTPDRAIPLRTQQRRTLLGFRELASYLNGVEHPEQARNVIIQALETSDDMTQEVFSAYGELVQRLEHLYDGTGMHSDNLDDQNTAGHIAETMILALASRTAANQLNLTANESVYIAGQADTRNELNSPAETGSLTEFYSTMDARNQRNVIHLPLATTHEDDINGVDAKFYIPGVDQEIPLQIKARIAPEDRRRYPPETMLIDLEEATGIRTADIVANEHTLANAMMNEVNGTAEQSEIQMINRAAHILQYRLSQQRDTHNYSRN